MQDNMKFIVEKLGANGAKLLQMDSKKFQSFIGEFDNKTRTKVAGNRLLKDYSPWLGSFQANQFTEVIEIPGLLSLRVRVWIYRLVAVSLLYTGQYGGEAKPLPEYHTKIAGFEEKVSHW
jgi:hypothetical protein